MDTLNKSIRKVAVLGAGVMGAQIAAHFANAGVATLLFDLPAKKGDKNSTVTQAIKRLQKLKPAPFTRQSNAELIIPANYDQHLESLVECDLIIEAIAERLEWKEDLYTKIVPHLNDHAIVASNTSGLGINHLAELMPASVQKRFCGIHFFNPPRYMTLVELIPNQATEKSIVNFLETFLVSTLGKGVVIAKDTPNFIANRVGVFSSLNIFHHTEQFGLGFDVVDSLTGTAIGRAKSATYRTADIVGLDTMVHVVNNMKDAIDNDPWHPHFEIPIWLQELVNVGALGQKSGAGIYKKQGKNITVLNRTTGEYTEQNKAIDDNVAAILKNKDWAVRFEQLRASEQPQAQFLWSIFRDLFHYCAVHLETIANNVRDVDLAMRWGYGWKQGPFEIWQQAGWQQVATWVSEDIEQGKTLAAAPLPAWVTQNDRQGVYFAEGAFSPATSKNQARSELPVYRRQLFPASVLNETYDEGATLFETDAVRLWHTGDDVGILSFKSKKNTISNQVLEGVIEALSFAEQHCRAFVLWQRQEDNFSYGADLRQFSEQAKKEGPSFLAGAVALFQQTSQALRYSSIPTVAALRGMALGGGCELPMHCDRIVAAAETYIGLVEVGVGLIPAGGGTKELAYRASMLAGDKDLFDFIADRFKLIAMAQVATSAHDAIDKGILRDSDVVVFNPHEILHVAKQQAIAISESGYRPPIPRQFKVAGKDGIATIKALLLNMREGGFISDYDFYLASKVGEAICGGNIETNSVVDEEWMLRLEREIFVEFASNEKTQARIEYTLNNGKPLRN